MVFSAAFSRMVVQYKLPHLFRLYSLSTLYGHPPPLISEILVPGPESSALQYLIDKQDMLKA